MKTDNLKVLIITNIISPYRIPFFNCLSQGGKFQLKVVVLSENESNREWIVEHGKIQFDYEILKGWHSFVWRWTLPIHLNIGLYKAFRDFNPDIVITTGYDAPAYWEALLYSKVFGNLFVLWNESTLQSTTFKKGFISKVKRFIISQADAYIAFGEKAVEYLDFFGADSDRIFKSIDTVDVSFFSSEVKSLKNNSEFKAKRKNYPEILFLYVGRLAKNKGIFTILEALVKIKNPEIGFMIVGSGPQEEKIRRFCRVENLNNVYFEGFQQKEKLPYYYALSDVLILPSFKEPWGLVVNEALAGGLYVLCSFLAGCAQDVINEEYNGKLFDPYNVEELTSLMLETIALIGDIRGRRENISRNACMNLSINNSIKGFLDVIDFLKDYV